MAKISKVDIYPTDNTLNADDSWVGTDAQNSKRTKTYTLGNVLTFLKDNISTDIPSDININNIPVEKNLGIIDYRETDGLINAINNLSQYEINANEIAYFTGELNNQNNINTKFVYVSKLGKGTFGLSSTAISMNDLLLLNPVQPQTEANSLLIRTIITGNQILGGNIIHRTGTLIFDSYDIVFQINDVLHTPANQVLELATTQNMTIGTSRIDVFVADGETGKVEILTGQASTNPQQPIQDFATQLFIDFVTVNALATVPVGYEGIVISNETDTSPVEWNYTGTTSFVNINDSFTGGSSGSKSIRVPNYRDALSWEIGTGSLLFPSGYILFDVLLSTPVNNARVDITLKDTNTSFREKISYAYSVSSSKWGVGSFDIDNTTDWQTIIIPVFSFYRGRDAEPFNTIEIDSFLFEEYNLDNIRLQESINVVPTDPNENSPNPTLQEVTDSGNTSINVIEVENIKLNALKNIDDSTESKTFSIESPIILLVDSNDTVHSIASSGNVISSITIDEVETLTALTTVSSPSNVSTATIDSNDNIYVVYLDGSVKKITSDGVVTDFTTLPTGTIVRDITTHTDGRILLSNGAVNEILQISTIGVVTRLTAVFDSPYGIVYHKEKNYLYISDDGGSISYFDLSSLALENVTGIEREAKVLLIDGEILYSLSNNTTPVPFIEKVDIDEDSDNYGEVEDVTNGLTTMTDMVMSDNGTVYIQDFDEKKVFTLTRSGAFSEETPEMSFDSLLLDSTDNIYLYSRYPSLVLPSVTIVKFYSGIFNVLTTDTEGNARLRNLYIFLNETFPELLATYGPDMMLQDLSAFISRGEDRLPSIGELAVWNAGTNQNTIIGEQALRLLQPLDANSRTLLLGVENSVGGILHLYGGGGNSGSSSSVLRLGTNTRFNNANKHVESYTISPNSSTGDLLISSNGNSSGAAGTTNIPKNFLTLRGETGLVELNSLTNALIAASATGKVAVTREYLELIVSGISGGGTGVIADKSITSAKLTNVVAAGTYKNTQFTLDSAGRVTGVLPNRSSYAYHIGFIEERASDLERADQQVSYDAINDEIVLDWTGGSIRVNNSLSSGQNTFLDAGITQLRLPQFTFAYILRSELSGSSITVLYSTNFSNEDDRIIIAHRGQSKIPSSLTGPFAQYMINKATYVIPSVNEFYSLGEANKDTTPLITKLGIISMGDSILDGRVPMADADVWLNQSTPTIPNANIYNHFNDEFQTFELGSYSGTFNPTDTRWGWDMEVYHKLQEYLNDDIYIVKEALGGTGFRQYWDADTDKIAVGFTKATEELEDRIRKADKLAKEQGIRIEWRAVLMSVGSNETQETDVAEFEMQMSKFMAYIRGVVGNPKLKFIAPTLAQNSSRYKTGLTSTLNRLAKRDSYFFKTDTLDGGTVGGDNIHPDAAMSIAIGEQVFQEIKDYASTNSRIIKNDIDYSAGTVLNIDNREGTYHNFGSNSFATNARATTTYTIGNEAIGGKLTARVNAASITITDSTYRTGYGNSFIANTDMYLKVENIGGTIKHWFETF